MPDAAPVEEDIREAPEDRPPRKLPKWIGRELRGDVLSEHEAKDLFDDLVGTYALYCEWADSAISHTNKARAKCEIWSSIDDEDLETLAKFAIWRGTKSRRVAQAVRGMVASKMYAEAGLIVGDAFMESLDFYRAHGGIWLWTPSVRLNFGSVAQRFRSRQSN